MPEKTPINPKGAGRPSGSDPEAIKKAISNKLLKQAGSDSKGALTAARLLIELHNLSGIHVDDTNIPQTEEEQFTAVVRMLQAAGQPMAERAIAAAFAPGATISPEEVYVEEPADVGPIAPSGGGLA